MLKILFLVSVIMVSGFAGPALAQPNAAQTNRPIQDKWAVVIGVSRFASPGIPVLRYPSKDAQDFYNFLVTKGNFARDHVLLLRDERATKVNILDAFGDGFLPRRVLENDLVVVFISSHGSPKDVAGENFIIAYDTDPNRPYATGIRLQDLSSELTKRTGCDRIVLLLDACHSGAAVASGEKGLARAPSNFSLDSVTGVGQLVISSSKPDESSWESKRYPNGVFTKQLITTMESNGPELRLTDVYRKLRDNVQQEVRFDRVASQTPMMLNKWRGLDVSLCAKPAAPRSVLPALPDQPRDSDVSSVTTREPDSPAIVASKSTLGGREQAPLRDRPDVNRERGTAIDRSRESEVPDVYGRSTTRTQRAPVMMTTDWRNNGGDVTLESGTTLITEDQISSLPYKVLVYMLNAAYARHGRGFSAPDIQEYYNRQSWYRIDPDYHYRRDDPRVVSRGTTDDPLVINERRTPKQWANILTIKRVMEKKRRSSIDR